VKKVLALLLLSAQMAWTASNCSTPMLPHEDVETREFQNVYACLKADTPSTATVKGTIVQTKDCTSTASYTTSSSNYGYAQLTCSLPSLSATADLVRVCVYTNFDPPNTATMIGTIYRGFSTDLCAAGTGCIQTAYTAGANAIAAPAAYCLTDSPVTISSTTWNFFARVTAGSGIVNVGGALTRMTLDEISQ
jgi:hypothetical protein